MAAQPAPASGLPRFALGVYFVLACAVLVGLTWIWPKYQARRAGLQTNYEGRVKGHEHRVRVQAEALEQARREGRDPALPSAVTWPVIVAGASVAIPCLALVFALATGKRPKAAALRSGPGAKAGPAADGHGDVVPPGPSPTAEPATAEPADTPTHPHPTNA